MELRTPVKLDIQSTRVPPPKHRIQEPLRRAEHRFVGSWAQQLHLIGRMFIGSGFRIVGAVGSARADFPKTDSQARAKQSQANG